MKIAPTLQSWTFDDGKWSATMGAGDAQTQASKELRALLAVARAATKESEEFIALSRLARGTMPRELDGDEIGRRVENIADRLGQALARLDKVSTGRSGKGESK